jgi:hypothetical protein
MVGHKTNKSGSNWDKHTDRDKGNKQKKKKEDGWIDMGKKTNSQRNKDRSKCYITTACLTARHLPDNCHELEAMRQCRDAYVATRPDGLKVIESYYACAPKIVRWVNSQPDSKNRWEDIYLEVQETVRLVDLESFEQAFACYTALYERLYSCVADKT